MKKLFFFCSILALGATKPNGFYHQEYSYKSSSQSFKNNELQHKNEDQGYYSKDGDLEGRLTPKVNSQSQHSEYRNPKLTSGYQAERYSGAAGANYLAGSEGQLGASGLQHAGAVDGYASSDRVLDLSNVYNSRGYNREGYGASQGYGSSQSNYGGASSNYGYSRGGSQYGYVQSGTQGTSGYATNANLNTLMQRLQDDMTRQLEHAIYKQYQTSGYSSSVSNSQMNTDIRLLEEELKRNLTRQLQDSLRTQYGSNTYTVVQGRPSTVPSYSEQELSALTRRLEDDLISKLHQSVRTTYNRETSYASSSNTYRPVIIYPATTSRPYYERPVITTPNVIRYSVSPNIETIYPGNLVVQTPSNIRYTPIPNPDSLTQIASRTQSDINTYLDTALQNLYSTYLQTDRSSSYSVSDFDNEVNRIKDEIIRKLSYNLEDGIRRNYGQQILKNDNYYSISSNGDISTQYNYNLRDYDNLKKQVEENLLRKLNQTTNTYRNQYTQRQQSQYRQTSNTYTVTYRPTYYTSGTQLYDYSDLQRQLSQQLQNALNQHRYSQSSSYSSSASHNPQAYQTSLDELSRELQRNLTEQLGNFRAQASSSSSSSYGYTSGSSGGHADFESMKNQLQNQLMQQLRQGLQNQHQYSASASYSANANYGMRQAYGSYPSTCLTGCSKRRRRDLSQYYYNSGSKRHGVKSVRRFSTSQGDNQESSFSSPRYFHHPEELSYPAHHSMEFNRQSSYSNHFQSSHSKTHNQQTEEVEPEIIEDLILSNHETHDKPRGDQQQVEQLDDSLQQQLEPIRTTYKKTLKYVDHNNLEQSQDTFSEPLQKIQDNLSQQLMLGHKTTQEILANIGKLEDQNDLTQQLEVSHHGRLEDQSTVGRLHKFNQEAELSLSPQTIGQQVEDYGRIGNLHIPKHNDQEIEGQLNLDQQSLGQQLEDHIIEGHLQIPEHHDQEVVGQLTMNQQTLGQQVEDQNMIGHLQKPKHNDQEVEGQLTLDQQTLGQQLEEQNLIGHLHVPKHTNQEIEGQLTLNQQTLGQQIEEENIIGHLQKPKYHNQGIDAQLTLGQQTEDQNIIGHLHKPKYHNQDDESQLTLGQQRDNIGFPHLPKPKPKVQHLETQFTFGQQAEDQNPIRHFHKPKYPNQNFQEQQIGDDQNQQDLTQQLELENIPKAQLVQAQQLEDQNTLDDQNEEDLTQQLELENIRKPNHVQHSYNSRVQQQTVHDQTEPCLTTQIEIEVPHIPQVQAQKPIDLDQQLQEPDQLTQQLELLREPKNKKLSRDYEQQANADFNEQSLDQQPSDLSQQLEITHVKPKPVSGQQLVLEPVQKPQQQLQDDDDIQRLELEGKPKYNLDTQQIEDDLTQQLELSNSKREKPEADQQLQTQDDFDQNLEISRATRQKPEDQEQEVNSKLVLNAIPNQRDLTQQLEDANLVLVPKRDIPDQQLTIDEQESETTRPDILRPAQTVVDQILEEPEQKLELMETNNKRRNNKPTVEDLDQQLELQKPSDQEDQQLELMGEKRPKLDVDHNPNFVTLESELGSSPDTSATSQSSQTLGHSTQFSNVVITEKHNRHPTQVYGGYRSTDQRPFTNGHSGQFSEPTYPTSDTQTRVDSYENALKQQEALMDLLKKKVQEAHSSNQDLYGHRTIKKTVFINGKAVDTQETSQLIKPNGEVLELQGRAPLENTFNKNIYSGQLEGYMPSQHINERQNTQNSYFGNTLRSNYHVTGNPAEFSRNSQWFSRELNPLSNFGTDVYRSGFQGNQQTEFSGKSTRKVVHFVNGKPVSASEKIQILKPNGEIIERQHDLPTQELGSFANGLSGTEFGRNTHSYNIPQTYINNQNSAVSSHTFKKTARYVNGKLVDFSSSSQDTSPRDLSFGFGSGISNTELTENVNTTPFKHSPLNLHTPGIKTTRHFGDSSY